MRVLLADDHALFLEGMRNLLTLHGIQVVGTAKNGQEAYEKAIQLHPDIVLMDIRMPVCDGVIATRMIKAVQPETKIIMLTTSTDELDLLEAIKNGANGYLLKSLETGPFLTYLEGVGRGESAISRELSGVLLKAIARTDEEDKKWNEMGTTRPPGVELTPRQVEILLLVAEGLSNKELAEKLCLTEHTIKYHLGEIFRRLNVKNRSQAVDYAKRNGIFRTK